MTERLKLHLGGMWMVARISSLILPIFMPSYSDSAVIGNPIVLASVSMFILSFPCSLAAIPLAYFVTSAFGLGTTPLAGMYINVWLLVVLGAVQWFWIVPRVFRGTPMIQPLDLSDPMIDVSLPEADLAEFDLDGATRLERVLIQDPKRSL